MLECIHRTQTHFLKELEMYANFETYQFEAAHGRKPRGKGFWFFKVEGTVNFETSAYGTYAEAKKQVKDEIRSLNSKAIVTVYVLS